VTTPTLQHRRPCCPRCRFRRRSLNVFFRPPDSAIVCRYMNYNLAGDSADWNSLRIAFLVFSRSKTINAMLNSFQHLLEQPEFPDISTCLATGDSEDTLPAASERHRSQMATPNLSSDERATHADHLRQLTSRQGPSRGIEILQGGNAPPTERRPPRSRFDARFRLLLLVHGARPSPGRHGRPAAVPPCGCVSNSLFRLYQGDQQAAACLREQWSHIQRCLARGDLRGRGAVREHGTAAAGAEGVRRPGAVRRLTDRPRTMQSRRKTRSSRPRTTSRAPVGNAEV